MKTNALPKTIVKAVENVSASKYDNNVVFRKYPEKLTKNVSRFTLRTIDAKKIGSMQNKDGMRQPKANWDVHQDVMNEIFKLDPRPNIFVDTIYGRQHNANPQTVLDDEPVLVEEETPARTKRKYTKRATSAKPGRKPKGDKTMKQFLSAFKYLVAHPELMK